MTFGTSWVVRFGVVVQGPYLGPYTLGACTRHRALYSDAPIVLSTWEDDSPALARDKGELERLEITIVQSPKPKDPGPNNVNLQLTTTHKGLVALEERRVSHVMKCRTDVTVEADARELLGRLLRSHPRGFPHTSERIVLAQTFTRTGIPYHASDMVMLGSYGEMRAYFSAPFRSKSEPSGRDWLSWPLRERLFSERAAVHVEQYLCTAYLKRIGWTLRYSIRDWHDALAEVFCVVDDRMLGFRWLKAGNGYGASRWFNRDFIYPKRPPFSVNSSFICRRVTHDAWLKILRGKRPVFDAEKHENLIWLANLIWVLRDVPDVALIAAHKIIPAGDSSGAA